MYIVEKKMIRIIIRLSLVILLFNNCFINGAFLKRCYTCRSRGDLGSCKDPFKWTNATQIENEHGLAAVPCASGWCGKVIEGGNSYSTDDYDMATQRMCVQRGPTDNEDRCAYTIYNYKKVFMCFCQGDLCNSSISKFDSKHSNILFSCMLLLILFQHFNIR